MKEDNMRRCVWLLVVVVLLAAACGPSVNVEQERNALLEVDRQWSQTTKDVEKFVSYYSADASFYPQGMPIVTGVASIRETFSKMASMPGFSLQFTAAKADVGASGELGYTTGSYEVSMGDAGTEKGKYVTVWKKQSDGQWKVTEDIFNADAPTYPPTSHVMVTASGVTWGEAPPSLPPGGKMAVISGDPTKAEPFVIRAQLPAGYKVAPHWHPGAENVTVLSGTFSVGMGETFDQAALKDLTAGGYAALPAGMRHYAMTKTAATIQVHGMGPFALNYVNPADDPRQQKK
jgi:ketosteroid isomerase-like protein